MNDVDDDDDDVYLEQTEQKNNAYNIAFQTGSIDIITMNAKKNKIIIIK